MKRFAAWLTRLQLAHPVLIVLTAVVLSAASAPFIATLRIDARMVALLPENRQSVRDIELAEGRLRSPKALTIAVQSPSGDVDSMRRFADALAERLRALPEEVIGRVDADVRDFQEFARTHAQLFVPLEDLTRLRDAISAEARQARLDANPMYIDLEDEDERDIPPLDEVIDELQARGEQQAARFPDGYYQSPDGTLIALFVRTEYAEQGASGVVDATLQEIAALDPASFGDDLRVDLAGDVIVQGEEQAAITQELGIAILITVAGVIALVMLYFRRFRAVALLGAGLIPGTMISFAIASFTVGQLNIATAFLGSVLLGNGVNPSIIWLARYFEERRAGHSPADSLRVTHETVLIATLVASGAAAAAYASLMITDFRGFRDFGIIGGVGMTLSWVSAVVVLPAAALLFERLRPLNLRENRPLDLTAPFARLASRAPGAVLVVSVLLTLASSLLIAKAVANDPVEYDFRQLRSERPEGQSMARELSGRVNQILSASAQGRGIAMLGRTEEDIAYLKMRLDEERGDGAIFDGYRSADDLLPKETDEKLPLLADIRRLLLEIRPHADDERRERIDEYLPAEEIAVPTIHDIPESAARLFTERDGRRGLILVVEESEERSIWDGRYLVQWTQELRTILYEDGEHPPLVGQAPVFADMLDAIFEDMPKAIGAALLVTALLGFFGFRRMRERLLALSALLIGVVWMAASMALAGMRLHFLNFIAFPITFGNGIDYSVNVLQRFEVEGARGDEEAMHTAVRESGSAVFLCSLTTIIGYVSLLASANLAMNSFGLAMAISEVTCFITAILTVPSFVIWRARRRAKTE